MDAKRTMLRSTWPRRSGSLPTWPRIVAPASLCVLAVTLTACSSNSASPSTTGVSHTAVPSSNTGGGSNTGTGSGASGPTPGVTATTIKVGQVDDLSAPLPGLFKGAEDGTKAYFDYINSQGGVDGRKVELDAQDSAFQGGQVATETATQIHNDFALVGGFSLLDSSEKPLIDLAQMPDVGFSLNANMASDPHVYSPLPNPVNDYPLGLFKYLKQKYPNAVKHVGIIWESATASTKDSEHAFESAMTAAGFQIVYDRGAGPFETNFLSDIIAMQNDGVKMFITTELPDNYAATLAKEMQQQNFKPINIEGAAYSGQLLPLAGSAADGMYIEQGYALYLGQDANTVPAVKLFDTWMRKADSNPNFEIESVYGWTSAELFVDALKQAPNPPTRAGLIAALNKITFFDGGGLIPPTNPAGNVPSSCFLLAQVQNGHVVRVAPTPPTGFYCSSGGFLTSPDYTPVVRPTS